MEISITKEAVSKFGWQAIVHYFALELHNASLAAYGEPMDGDTTEGIAKCIQESLDALNGNL